MYINSVVSSRNAWTNLHAYRPHVIDELQDSLARVDLSQLSTQPVKRVRNVRRGPTVERRTETLRQFSPRDLAHALNAELSGLGWELNVRHGRLQSKYHRFFTIDYVRDQVGVELGLGKTAFAESSIFVKFPYLIEASKFDFAILLLPERALARQLPQGVATYESVSGLLLEMQPLTLQYPLVVAGISPEPSNIAAVELTSMLDDYLISVLGLSLVQMAVLNEGTRYEFKQTMPNTKKLAQEVCGFANLVGGGILLFGVDKSGQAVGVAAGKALDELQLQLVNVIRDSCTPIPDFEIHTFDNPERSGTAILAVRICELERKPCMTREKVYVRSGASVRTAGPDDIRRLVL